MICDQSDCFQTPAGWVTLGVSEGRVCRLHFQKSSVASHQTISPYRVKVLSWFEGASPESPPLDLSWASPFEQRVYRIVRRIPRGRILTYGEVARQLGSPGAARAVGGAMRRNQICLFIP